jgi:4-hydroxy-4-methyl-2-oxoglutarate aldolase
LPDESKNILARLRSLDTCALSDALDKLKLGTVVTGFAMQSGRGRIAGRAVTVKLGTGTPQDGPAKHLGAAAVERAGADDIIVIEQKTGIEAAGWGGLLSLGASLRGIQGVLCDGPVRDIDEARALSFPVFARSLTARTACGRIVELGTDTPIRFGEASVHPGDYVVADASAIVVIAAAEIIRVLETAGTIAVKEAAMAEALRRGEPIGAVMGANYEHMLKN